VRLPEFFSTSFKLHREADNAGNNPNTRAVAKDAQTAKSNTRQSIEVSSRRGILPGLKCISSRMAMNAASTPNMPSGAGEAQGFSQQLADQAQSGSAQRGSHADFQPIRKT
jgi:hypothetical protein